MNNNTKEDYVSFQNALLLKEKGFDVGCKYYYDEKYEELTYHTDYEHFKNSEIENGYDNLKFKMISAPTTQMVVKWIYDNFALWIVTDYGFHPRGFYWLITDIKLKKSYNSETHAFQPAFNSSNESYQAAIKYALKLI